MSCSAAISQSVPRGLCLKRAQSCPGTCICYVAKFYSISKKVSCMQEKVALHSQCNMRTGEKITESEVSECNTIFKCFAKQLNSVHSDLKVKSVCGLQSYSLDKSRSSCVTQRRLLLQTG